MWEFEVMLKSKEKVFLLVTTTKTLSTEAISQRTKLIFFYIKNMWTEISSRYSGGLFFHSYCSAGRA